MLSKEDNEFLCRVGPGTAMGNLLRRFWLPAMLSEELPEPDGAPIRLRMLGEDLVAFRDTNGHVGVLTANCSHRGASLFFGRNEECGLRCVYHGWKYDVAGNCVDMPNEPAFRWTDSGGRDSSESSDFEAQAQATSGFPDKIHHPAYPTREQGGVIWAYMGPRELAPALPGLEWAQLPASHRMASKWIQETNYLQGFEGDIDSSHSSFLHSYLLPTESPRDGTISSTLKAMDKSPKIVVSNTEYGFRYGARRAIGDGKYNWRVTQALMPTFSLIPFITFPAGGRAWIPIDDHRTMTFHFSFNPEEPLTEENRAARLAGRAFPPELIPGTFTPKRNRDSDYLLDRELQRTLTYTGIYGINDQDRAIQESMGPIYDRRKEHLGTADSAVATARRCLLKLARDLEQGIEPYAATHPEIYNVRAMDVNTPIGDFGGVVEEHGSGLLVHA